jgi:bifunctional ADP-heptose synthase (sugar kinase/adenylyltransferase)
VNLPQGDDLVLGDLVADEFILVKSPAFRGSVLILKHRERSIMPGSGITGRHLADLGVNVLPVGVVGDTSLAAFCSGFHHKASP